MTRWERRSTKDQNVESLNVARCFGCFVEKPKPGRCHECGYEETQPRPPLALVQGTVINNQYLLGRLLGGHGITGFTYLARDLRLGINVLMKEFLPRNLAGRNLRTGDVFPHNEKIALFTFGQQQFIDEAERLFKLNHPNLAKVRDLCRANGTLYVVMDYQSGSTLQELLVQVNGSFQPKEALEIFLPVLDALEAAHGQGILHLDLTPNNVILVGRRAPLLFGFAGARHLLAQRTLSLFTAVSAGYAAPEQYYNHREVGQCADVYGASALLYTLLTGAIPPEAIERGESDNLVAPIRLNPRVPKYLNYAVMRGLAVDVAQRPQTIADLRELVRDTDERMVDLAAGVSERPASGFSLDIRNPGGSRRALLLGAGLLTGATAALVVGYTYYDRTSEPTSLPIVESVKQQAVPTSPALPVAVEKPVIASPPTVVAAVPAPSVSAVPFQSDIVLPTAATANSALAVDVPDGVVERLTPAGHPVNMGSYSPYISYAASRSPVQAVVSDNNDNLVHRETVGGATQEPAQTVDYWLQLATTQFQQGHVDLPLGANALESYRAALALDSSNVIAKAGLENILGGYINLVDANIVANKLTDADLALTKARDLAPTDPRVAVLSERLQSAWTNQAVQQSTAGASKTVVLDAASAEKITRWLAQARRYVTKERYSGSGSNNALAKLKGVLALQPDNADALSLRDSLSVGWSKGVDAALATKDVARLDALLAQAKALDVTDDRVAQIKAMRDEWSVQPVAATEPAPMQAATVEPNIAALYARQRDRQDVLNRFRSSAISSGMPIVNIYYENGNHRESAFGITDNGRFLPAAPLKDGRFSFVWPTNAETVTMFYAARNGVDFDTPVVVTAANMTGQKQVASGLYWQDVFVNNSHAIAVLDNFAADSAQAPGRLQSVGAASINKVKMYLRGTLNSWGLDAPMEYAGNGVYRVVAPVAMSFSEYKFADEFWSAGSTYGGNFGLHGLSTLGGAHNLPLDVTDRGVGMYRYTLFLRAWPGHGKISFFRIDRVGDLPVANDVATNVENADATNDAGDDNSAASAAEENSNCVTARRAGPRNSAVYKNCDNDGSEL